jgi:hypothetical protein
MRKFLLVIATCLFCVSCGVKSDPEYKSQIDYNKAIYTI